MDERTATQGLVFVCAVAGLDAVLTATLFIPYYIEGNPLATVLVGALGYLGYLTARVCVTAAAYGFIVTQQATRWATVFIGAHCCMAVYLAATVAALAGVLL